MIKIKGLTFWYSKRNLVFENLSLQLKEGHIYGLLGKNGVGKTTLLKLITGLSFPKSGEVIVDDAIPGNRQPVFLSGIFLVPEEVSLPSMTAMKFAKTYGCFYPSFDLVQFKEFLVRFEVKPDQKLSGMSLGQKKKALLSFALASNTRYLFLDEPTNGLDIPSKATFRKLVVTSFNEKQTIVMATHQVRDLANLMDRIIIEHHGKIIINESIERIAEKLSFGLTADQIAPNDLLFKVDSFNQNETVSVNSNNQSGQVDIELLFNAATLNSENMSLIFNSNTK